MKPRNRFQRIDSARLGIDSWAPLQIRMMSTEWVSQRILSKTEQRRRLKNEKDVSNTQMLSSLNLLKELSIDETEC